MTSIWKLLLATTIIIFVLYLIFHQHDITQDPIIENRQAPSSKARPREENERIADRQRPPREEKVKKLDAEKDAAYKLEYAELRQKIEKKIGPEELLLLDKFSYALFNKIEHEWQSKVSDKNVYFRARKEGNSEASEALSDAARLVYFGQGMLIQSEFAKDPEWAEIAPKYFELMHQNGLVDNLLFQLQRNDKVTGYNEAIGPLTHAGEYFAELEKRRAKIEAYTYKFFKDYQIPIQHLDGIRSDASIGVWRNFGDAYYFPKLDKDYSDYRFLSEKVGRFK